MSVVPVPEKVVEGSIAAVKLAQIVQLVKDNQLLTAAVLFILWQVGMIAEATNYLGGMC